MFSYIDQFIPFVRTNQGYEHFHVPSDMFIESNKTSGRIKTEFCRKWLKTTEEFISQKPIDVPFCKIIAVLSVPYFWSSQIIIFMMRITTILFGTERDLNNFGFRLNRAILFVKNVILLHHFKRFVITRKLLMTMVCLKMTCGFMVI